MEHLGSGEGMQLKSEKGAFVLDVKFADDGSRGKITLDSGAGVSVWPKAMKTNLKMLPAKPRQCQVVPATRFRRARAAYRNKPGVILMTIFCWP